MRAILLVAMAMTLPPFSGFKVEGVTEYEKVTIADSHKCDPEVHRFCYIYSFSAIDGLDFKLAHILRCTHHKDRCRM